MNGNYNDWVANFIAGDPNAARGVRDMARETLQAAQQIQDRFTEHDAALDGLNAVLSRAPDVEVIKLRKSAAERALACLGLENGHAARDIRELRDLLEAWRDARRTAWQTTVKVITTGILAALLVGAAIKLKLMGGPQ